MLVNRLRVLRSRHILPITCLVSEIGQRVDAYLLEINFMSEIFTRILKVLDVSGPPLEQI